MAFKLVFSDEARYELKKLENETARRIFGKLIETKENPLHFFKRLSGKDSYRLRAGDYRIIANLSFESQTIFIVTIGHRKNVYDDI